MISLHEAEFLANGGEVSWIKSIKGKGDIGWESVPFKLRSLFELNAMLAHQPWLITKEVVQKLLRSNVEDSTWSVAEFVHALVLLVTFHYLSSVVLSCGIRSEIDLDPCFSNITDPHVVTKPLFDSCPPAPDVSNDAILDAPTETVFSSLNSDLLSSLNSISDEKLASVPVESGAIDSESVIQLAKPQSPASHTERQWVAYTPLQHQFAFLHYEDFDLKRFTMLREQDYSWKEHGYALVNRFYRGAGELIDLEFDLICELTDKKVGLANADADTTPLRRSVWYYSHRLFGVITSDFDYRVVNLLVSRNLKSFIKRSVCAPETIRFSHFQEAFDQLEFRDEEKLHCVLLAAEAKRQASLMYGLHSLMTYMNALN